MAKLRSTRTTHQLAYRAIRIEGGLIPADELTRLTLLADPKGARGVTKGARHCWGGRHPGILLDGVTLGAGGSRCCRKQARRHYL